MKVLLQTWSHFKPLKVTGPVKLSMFGFQLCLKWSFSQRYSCKMASFQNGWVLFLIGSRRPFRQAVGVYDPVALNQIMYLWFPALCRVHDMSWCLSLNRHTDDGSCNLLARDCFVQNRNFWFPLQCQTKALSYLMLSYFYVILSFRDCCVWVFENFEVHKVGTDFLVGLQSHLHDLV